LNLTNKTLKQRSQVDENTWSNDSISKILKNRQSQCMPTKSKERGPWWCDQKASWKHPISDLGAACTGMFICEHSLGCTLKICAFVSLCVIL
jgi:hypothetical protein